MDNQERDERADADTLDLGDLYPAEPPVGASFTDLRSELLERWSRLSRGGAIPTEGLLQPVGIDLRNPHSALLARMSEDQLQIVHMGEAMRQFDDPRRNEKGAFLRFLDCLGEQAIESGLPLDFEHWDNFRPGLEESVRGIALPLSDDGRRCSAVLAIFDSEAMAASVLALDEFPVEEELLLEQEIDPEAEPEAKPPTRSAPFFMVATSNRAPSAPGFRQRPAPRMRLTNGPAKPAPGPAADTPPDPISTPEPALEPAAQAPVEPAPPESTVEAAPIAKRKASTSPEAVANGKLAKARSLAQTAAVQETRSHHALYDALGAAYELMHRLFAVPEYFAEILAEAGLSMQERAPMTPVVKLVFGPDYDRTRLSEYAAVLSHAHRIKLPDYALGEYLKGLEGGIRTLVRKEREARQGSTPADSEVHLLAPQIVKRLRRMPVRGFDSIAQAGEEFALVLVRRSPDGAPQVVGEVPTDKALLNRATRRVIKASIEAKDS